MCTIYFENIQCGLVNIYHYLLTGRKKKKKEAKYKNLQKENWIFSSSELHTCVGGVFW